MFADKFEYHAPASLQEAASLLGQHGEDAKIVTGGMSLIPLMKLRLAAPSHLIDLRKLNDLKGVSESGGKIVFYPRSSPDVVTIVAADLAAHEEGSDTPRPFLLTDIPDLQMPSEVNIKFIDPAKDYQASNQRGQRSNTVAILNVRRIELPVTMTEDEALTLARRILWTQWANRQAMEFSLPPSHFHVEEGDVCLVPGLAETFRVVVLEAAFGENRIVQCRGILEQAHTHTVAVP